jgi:hypothetical protein
LDYELLYFNCDANTEQKLKKTLQEMAGKPNLDASKVNKVLEYLEIGRGTMQRALKDG